MHSGEQSRRNAMKTGNENFTEEQLNKAKDRLVEVGCESDYMVDAILDHPEKAAKLISLYKPLFKKALEDNKVRSEFEPLCMFNYGAGVSDTEQLIDKTILKLETLTEKYGGSPK